jgi:hypothetical protein
MKELNYRPNIAAFTHHRADLDHWPVCARSAAPLLCAEYRAISGEVRRTTARFCLLPSIRHWSPLS